MTYELDMVVIVNYNYFYRKTYVTYILDMLAILKYNLLLPEDLLDL